MRMGTLIAAATTCMAISVPTAAASAVLGRRSSTSARSATAAARRRRRSRTAAARARPITCVDDAGGDHAAERRDDHGRGSAPRTPAAGCRTRRPRARAAARSRRRPRWRRSPWRPRSASGHYGALRRRRGRPSSPPRGARPGPRSACGAGSSAARSGGPRRWRRSGVAVAPRRMQDRAWTPVKSVERVHPACSGKGLQQGGACCPRSRSPPRGWSPIRWRVYVRQASHPGVAGSQLRGR